MIVIEIPGPSSPPIKDNFWYTGVWRPACGSRDTILDMSNVEEIDKLVICYLATLLGFCRNNGGRLVLVGAQHLKDDSRRGEVQRIFQCFEDETTAIRYFSGSILSV
ncbi:MAG: hypothetical protein M1383_01755 [Patescibacteria group bacterium]|nr:hypothetical protein [Patescibacteria group bacterium]